MHWYDSFAHVYDLSLERIYRAPRSAAFARLDPEAGMEGVGEQGRVVIDLACGTGQNFPFLLERLAGEEWHRHLIGIDASAGMLARAQRRIERHDWRNVHLVEADARNVSREQLAPALGQSSGISHVVCTLGLTAIADWQEVFARLFGLLEPGGQFLIMDVWAERWVPQTTCVQWIARADLERRVWQPLEQAADDFELRFLDGSPHVFGGRLFAATGLKPR